MTHQRLADRFAGQTVVAVTHAGFVVASLLVLFDIPRPGTGASLEPSYTSLTEWRLSGTRLSQIIGDVVVQSTVARYDRPRIGALVRWTLGTLWQTPK
jgi:hypothetical protein